MGLELEFISMSGPDVPATAETSSYEVTASQWYPRQW